MSGGFCREGLCRGDFVEGDFVRGDCVGGILSVRPLVVAYLTNSGRFFSVERMAPNDLKLLCKCSYERIKFN